MYAKSIRIGGSIGVTPAHVVAFAVAAVTIAPSASAEIEVQRVNSAGYLADPNFNGGNGVQTDVDSSLSTIPIATLPASGGKIVVVGVTQANAPQYQLAAVRLNSDGSPDGTFGKSGMGELIDDFSRVAPRDYTTVWPGAATIDSSGRLIVASVAGYVGQDSKAVAVVRYTASGLSDTTFGKNGYVTTDMGNGTLTVSGVAVDGNGKIVVAGSSGRNSSSDFAGMAFVRYNTNGTLDTSFASGGIYQDYTSHGTGTNSIEFPGRVAIDSNNRIVTAGLFYADLSSNQGTVYVTRLSNNGTVDTSFGWLGVVAPFTGDPWSGCMTSVAVISGNKILVSGDGSSGQPTVVRLATNGALDTTFGSGGIATRNGLPGVGEGNCSASSMAIGSNGSILLGGTFVDDSGGGDYYGGLVRFTSSGAKDSSLRFGEPYAPEFYPQADYTVGATLSSVFVDSSGNIVYSGAQCGTTFGC